VACALALKQGGREEVHEQSVVRAGKPAYCRDRIVPDPTQRLQKLRQFYGYKFENEWRLLSQSLPGRLARLVLKLSRCVEVEEAGAYRGPHHKKKRSSFFCCHHKNENHSTV
jgi:hypothetical protein